MFGVTAFTASAAEKLRVEVSVLPQIEMVQAVGGEHVEVAAFLNQGQACGEFNPLPSQMRRLAEADLFIRVGAAYEQSLLPRLRTGYPNLQVIDPPQWFNEDTLACCAHHELSDHHHHQHDPHIWLNPDFMLAHINVVQAALTHRLPQHSDYFEERALRYKAEVRTMLEEVAAQLRPWRNRKFFVFHPAYGSFAEFFTLEQVPLEIEGKEPSPRQMNRLVKLARAERTKIIFIQPQEPRASADVLAQAIGASVEELDPLSAEWTNSMRIIASRLVAAFEAADSIQ